MRFELMYESFFKIIEGIPLTLQVVSISTVLGLALAIIVALMRISGKKSMSIPAYYFVYLIRGTPSVTAVVFCLLWSWSIFIYSREYIVANFKRAILVWYHYTDYQHWRLFL